MGFGTDKTKVKVVDYLLSVDELDTVTFELKVQRFRGQIQFTDPSPRDIPADIRSHLVAWLSGATEQDYPGRGKDGMA
jgi:hypothetical protein